MLTISGDPASSRAVTWRTDYSITKSLGQIIKANPSPELENGALEITGTNTPWEKGSDYAMGHKVVFNNLEPSALYAYRVGDGVNWSEWFQFKTASDKRDPFSFIYLGDLQNGLKSYCSRLLRQAFYHQPDAAFMIFAGDLVNSSTENYWREFFYAGDFIFGMIPSVATPGNHEYSRLEGTEQRVFSPQWNQIFINPDNGSEHLKNNTYYFDYQGVRFISVDSYHLASILTYTEEQLSWLEKVLSENEQKWTVVFLHYPVFSCSQGRNNQEYRVVIKPVLEKYGVDLVLQGHDHTYCRGFNLDSLGNDCINPPMYVVSVAGSKMYGLSVDKWADKVASMTQLYQIIDVKEDTLTFNSYTVTGEKYDSFSLVKQAGKANLFIEGKTDCKTLRVDIPERAKKKYTIEDLEQYQKTYK
jgi:3',5'-cyclic AMP phosphodiesterase CpdA